MWCIRFVPCPCSDPCPGPCGYRVKDEKRKMLIGASRHHYVGFDEGRQKHTVVTKSRKAMLFADKEAAEAYAFAMTVQHPTAIGRLRVQRVVIPKGQQEYYRSAIHDGGALWGTKSANGTTSGS